MNKQNLFISVFLGILLIMSITIGFVMVKQHNSGKKLATSMLPIINEKKVMKHIDYEIFKSSNGGRYDDGKDDNTFIDGEKIRDTQKISIINIVYASATHNDIPIGGYCHYSDFLKEHRIENLVTIWYKEGNSFVAKGHFIVKNTGAKYPFAFEFNVNYIIIQKWFGKNIKI